MAAAAGFAALPALGQTSVQDEIDRPKRQLQLQQEQHEKEVKLLQQKIRNEYDEVKPPLYAAAAGSDSAAYREVARSVIRAGEGGDGFLGPPFFMPAAYLLTAAAQMSSPFSMTGKS